MLLSAWPPRPAVSGVTVQSGVDCLIQGLKMDPAADPHFPPLPCLAPLTLTICQVIVGPTWADLDRQPSGHGNAGRG